MIRVENCPDICFHVIDSLTYPLIMYSKLVWPVKYAPKLAGKCLMSGHYHKLYYYRCYVDVCVFSILQDMSGDLKSEIDGKCYINYIQYKPATR